MNKRARTNLPALIAYELPQFPFGLMFWGKWSVSIGPCPVGCFTSGSANNVLAVVNCFGVLSAQVN